MFTRFTESTCVPSLHPVEAECFPKCCCSVTECNAQLQISRFYFIVGTQKKTKRVKDYPKNTWKHDILLNGCLWISTEQNYQEVYQYFSVKLGKIKSKCRQRSNKNGAKYVLILMYSHNFNPSKFQKRPWRNWNIINSIPPKTCLEELE